LTGLCGHHIYYDVGLAEDLDSVAGPVCKLVESLLKPSRRLYVRVNTIKVSVDVYLEMLEARGLKFYVDEEVPEAVWAPVEGPYRIPFYDKLVVADKRASESVLMGSDLYTPGVLEARGVKRGDMVTVVSPRGVPVGSGVAVVGWDEARATGRGLFVKITTPIYRAPKVSELPGSGELIYGQSITSMYVARLLNPQPGEVIVDMTAAPGGKVSHVAQLAGPKVKVIAIDRPSKVRVLKESLSKLGLHWVEVMGGDSRYASELLGSLAGRVDAVLLDPPCTDIGVIPKVEDVKSYRDSANMSEYQKQFVREAYRILKPGGRLVYSTCTLTDLESEAIVEYALSIGFELEDYDVKPGRGRVGVYGVRFTPHLDGTPGFFISLKLVKKGRAIS